MLKLIQRGLERRTQALTHTAQREHRLRANAAQFGVALITGAKKNPSGVFGVTSVDASKHFPKLSIGTIRVLLNEELTQLIGPTYELKCYPKGEHEMDLELTLLRTAATHKTPINVWKMISELKSSINERLVGGKVREGDRIAHLLYFEMNDAERKTFHEQLDGFIIPDSPYKLEWISSLHYFKIMPGAPA